MLVQTKAGMIDRDLLIVEDIVEEHDNARVVATEWRLRSEAEIDGASYPAGEIMRRDVAASILRGHALSGEQGDFS